MRVLSTGGAGFIGANIAVGLASRHPDWEISALDNLAAAAPSLGALTLLNPPVEPTG